VSPDLSGSTARRLSIGLLGFAFAGSGLLMSAPAHAVATDADSSAVRATDATASRVCLKPANRTTRWHRDQDTNQVSTAVKEKVADVLASGQGAAATTSGTTSSARTAAAPPSQVIVPVVIHIIHGRHRGERRVTKQMARRMFYTLRAGYNGRQSPGMAATGVIFEFNRITVSRNERWFHATPYSRADRQMKRRLRLGKARVLNIYINRPRVSGLLGFSTFPWQRARYPQLDGVTISEISMPGGRAVGFNLGDTTIHETGHWLGLLHTFEGGCTAPGDYVADTPAEANPASGCPPDTQDTCLLDPGTDPIHNFMDYANDACMNQFTPGQGVRMRAAYTAFRAGR
jgi:hypothetical protein